MGGLTGHVLQTEQLRRGHTHSTGQIATSAAPSPATTALQTVPTATVNRSVIHGSRGHRSQITSHTLHCHNSRVMRYTAIAHK